MARQKRTQTTAEQIEQAEEAVLKAKAAYDAAVTAQSATGTCQGPTI